MSLARHSLMLVLQFESRVNSVWEMSFFYVLNKVCLLLL